jgi:hypothetical protein
VSTTHPEAPTLVHEPSAADSLAAELLARRRKRLPRATLALVGVAVAAVAFIGGVEIQKHLGTTSSSSSGIPSLARGLGNGNFPASSASNANGGGAPSFGGSSSSGFPGFGGGATSGTVTLIKGSTLYVTTASGNTVQVNTSTNSRVTKSVSGSVKSIHPGDSVTVVGSQSKTGAVTARQITIGGN